ncbi:unnamed protein product [Symbiodinium natans]|uniref:DUF4116 domain-containing protein n=1 Tax=Symbiodinium natans TaxID=878477 RepID=A0A812KKP9_9DINO|nr:unnamed protein product [Symbiodinium natans]
MVTVPLFPDSPAPATGLVLADAVQDDAFAPSGCEIGCGIWCLSSATSETEARGRLLEEIRRGPEAAYIALRDAPPELQGDKAVVLAAVKENALALEFASEVVKEDKDFVLAAVKENGAVLKFACLRAWRSTSACRGSGQGSREAYESAEEEARQRLLERIGRGPLDACIALQYAPPEIQGDKEVVLAAAKETFRALQFASEALNNDKDFVLAVVKENALALAFASTALRGDKDVVLAAVTQSGATVKFASAELKKDKDFVLALVKENGLALKYVADERKEDREVVLAAVKKHGSALKYVTGALKEDREVVLAAVKKTGLALKYAADALKVDKEVVLAAVKEMGRALKYAADALRENREVVLAAVQKNGSALEYATDALKEDREVVLAAVQEDGTALEYACKEVRASRSFVLEAVQATRAWWLVKFAADELGADTALIERYKAAAGTGLIFSFYDSYSCFARMRDRFPTAGASVPGGTAYEHVMDMLRSDDHGSTATVWFDQEPVFGHCADDGKWSHPSTDCGRDMVPVPLMEGRDAKWRSTVDSRSASLEPEVGKKYACWCCHWLREVRKHHQAGEVICCAVSNIYDTDWAETYGAGSSELADADAEEHGLQKEVFKNGKPISWGTGTIRISNGDSHQRRAPIHPRTAKPLGVGCRWERQALDGMEFPVYAFFMP